MDLLATTRGRRAIFAALYLSEGAPIGFIWWALPTRMKLAGADVPEIAGLLALLAWPWALKALWAPLVDVLRSPRWNFRAWILAAQTVMGLCLIPLFWLDLHADYAWVFALLATHGFAAATQDVAIDGLAIAVTPERERGAINGWMQAGMLGGRTFFGPGVLKLGHVLGAAWIYAALLAAIWFSALLVLWCARDPVSEARPVRGRALGAFARALRSALARRNTWLGLCVALLGGAGFEAVGAMAGPFLMDAMGDLPKAAAESRVGDFYLWAVGAMLSGAVLGGWLADRLGHRRAVVGYLLALTAGIVALARAASGDAPSADGLTALLVGVYFGIGLFTAGTYALFMGITDPRLGATQFSAFMGMTNVCESWSAGAVAAWKPSLGYGGTFALLALISLCALPFLALLREGPRALDAVEPADA